MDDTFVYKVTGIFWVSFSNFEHIAQTVEATDPERAVGIVERKIAEKYPLIWESGCWDDGDPQVDLLRPISQAEIMRRNGYATLPYLEEI